MNQNKIHSLIQELDEQIGKLALEQKSAPILTTLLELRNNWIIKYEPDPQVDWAITNTKALRVLKHFRYTVIYK